jgi:hypothetical protein
VLAAGGDVKRRDKEGQRPRDVAKTAKAAAMLSVRSNKK